jgi:oxygen-dependent protoporphyrinogen oxidase
VRGFLDQRKKVEEMRKKYPPKPGAKSRTFFSSFYKGMQVFTDGLADGVGRERILTGVSATAVDRTSEGGWRVTLSDGRVLDGDALIVATEVWAAAKLLTSIDARVAELLGEIPCSSSATVPELERVVRYPA